MTDYVPRYLGSLTPDGSDIINYRFDTHPTRMQQVTNNLPFHRGVTSQGYEGTCAPRAFKVAVETFCNRFGGKQMEVSHRAAYTGGRLYAARTSPQDYLPLQDAGVRIGDICAWAQEKGILSTAQWSDTNGVNDIPPDALYQDTPTIDYMNLHPGYILDGVHAAVNLGLPVLIDAVVGWGLAAISGPFATHKSQYYHPERLIFRAPGVAGRHAFTALDIDVANEWVICANSQGNSWSTLGMQGLIALDFQTFAVNALSAIVITRVGDLRAPALPETMVARGCPGRGVVEGEPDAVTFTFNVRRFCESLFTNPALTTNQERAKALLAAMEAYGVTRDEVAYSFPTSRETVDLLLSLA